MKKQVLMILIVFEILIFIALLLGDVGIINTGLTSNPIKNISMHVTAAIIIYICVAAYRRSE